jgi:type IV pilus assembly protein PilM
MFERIREIAQGFLGEKRQSVIGVDIGSSSAKVVQLRKERGRAVLETYGELSLGPYGATEVGRAVKLAPEKIASAIKDLLKEANVSTADAALTVPMRASMTAVITVPTYDDERLKTMVPIEARKYIPVPMSQVTLDWFKLPKPEAEEADAARREQTDVMIVAIHNETLDTMSRVVEDAQLNASFFEIEMFSAIRAVIDPNEAAATMIIDIGASATKAYIVERGVVRDSHSIPRGSQEITLDLSKSIGITVDYAEKLKRNAGKNELQQDQKLKEIADLVFQPIWSEAMTFIIAYQKRARAVVSRVILVGGGAMFPGLASIAQQKLGVEVLRADPFAKVYAPAFLQGVLRENGMAFAGAIGIALRKLELL